MLPADWQELAPLVDLVLDAPPDQRREFSPSSARRCRRRAQLERLVAECERDLPLLDRPAAERFASLLDGAVEAPLPDVLGGRYRIEREIGRGGMARVYLAHDIKHARNVAVKVIRPDFAASLGRERFLREIGIAARLRHPNIVPLYDSGDADGVLYFVMPYEEGPSLRARLTRWRAAGGRMRERAARRRARAGLRARAGRRASRREAGQRDVVGRRRRGRRTSASPRRSSVAQTGAAAQHVDASWARESARRRTWRPSRRSAIRPRIIAPTSIRSAASPTSCSPGSRRFTVCRRIRSSVRTSGRSPFRSTSVGRRPGVGRPAHRAVSREGTGCAAAERARVARVTGRNGHARSVGAIGVSRAESKPGVLVVVAGGGRRGDCNSGIRCESQSGACRHRLAVAVLPFAKISMPTARWSS